jgi:hypothetical protein
MIEIESPAERSQRRGRRAVVIATAAALVAGTGGFLVGRSTHQTGPGAGAVPTTTPTTLAAPAATAAPVGTVETLPTTTLPGSPMDAVVAQSGSASAAGASGGLYVPGAYEEPQMQLVATRTTPSGVLIRVHLNRYQNNPYTPGGPPGWLPAAWCYPQGDLRVSIVAPDSVNLTYAAWYEKLKDGLSVTTFASGYAEGSPVFGAVAQVDPDVTMVTMTTASGLTDSTAPINGLALLEVDGGIEQDITFTTTKADGSSTTKPVGDLATPYATAEYHRDCDPPPPALPDAGEQPSDPTAAEAAVRASWGIVHDFGGDAQSRRSYVDDDTGVVDAWTALQQGSYADAAKAATADIAEVVFTSPTEAWFRYDLLTPIINFYDRYGIARLGADGVWIFTRQTICQDISLAPGFGCTPPVDTLYPPSAAGDPRYTPQPVEGADIVGD